MMFEIENSVRELIISMMESKYGAKWYKDKLPGDVLKKYKKGLQYEQSLAINDLTSYHPIYYIDFPQLREIIIRVDNWKNVFKQLFKDKERINAEKHIEFLQQIIKHHPNRKIIVIEDNARPHISKKVDNFVVQNKNKFAIYRIPSYAPELNPDEHVWEYLKAYKLKAHQAQNKEELRRLVKRKMQGIQRKKGLVNSFFAGTYVI